MTKTRRAVHPPLAGPRDFALSDLERSVDVWIRWHVEPYFGHLHATSEWNSDDNPGVGLTDNGCTANSYEIVATVGPIYQDGHSAKRVPNRKHSLKKKV